MLRERRVVFFLIALFLFLLLANRAYGQYGQYGGPAPSQSILIEKFVAKPGSTTDFFDNLSPTDPRFSPDQTVNFKLTVKNTSDTTLTNVTVKDFVPDFLQPMSGPGNFDSSSRTISFGAGDFAVNEEKTYFLSMKVVSQNQLPSDKSIVCVVNKGQASNDNVSDDDTSQLCIEKQVVGAVQVPTAGPELGVAILTLNTLVLGAGLWLKKRTS